LQLTGAERIRKVINVGLAAYIDHSSRATMRIMLVLYCLAATRPGCARPIGNLLLNQSTSQIQIKASRFPNPPPNFNVAKNEDLKYNMVHRKMHFRDCSPDKSNIESAWVRSYTV
jgi:hypothetical protein